MPHAIGAVKRGAMLAYEADVTAAEAHGTALGLCKARIATGDRRPATGDRRPATGDRRPATGA
ncbi:hypothetical protein [Sorangium sp. So ce1182]|uniref:hypothetical protein n=1 Tax=Sorangium sp. So ce1182 TaxID=3133334 RepID=UPI003F5E8598